MVPIPRDVRVLDPMPLALRIAHACGAIVLFLALATAAIVGAFSNAISIVAALLAFAHALWATTKLWTRLRPRARRSVRVDARGLYVGERLQVAKAAAPANRNASFLFLPALAGPGLWAVLAVFATLAGVPVLFGADLPAGASFATLLVLRVLPNVGGALVLGLLSGLLIRRFRIAVDVGLDGLRIRRGDHERYVPHQAIERVQPCGSTTLRFKARGEAEERWFSFVGFGDFVHRLEEAHRLAAPPSQDPAHTVFATETAVAAYRQSAYPNEVLLRVMEDASQPVGIRKHAADALRYRLDPEDRDRVRRMAATTASSDLRTHLEELATLEEPLDAVRAARR